MYKERRVGRIEGRVGDGNQGQDGEDLRTVKCRDVGIPWRSIGWDSVLSQPRTQVQSLVGELRSHKPYSAAKKKNHKPKTHTKKS